MGVYPVRVRVSSSAQKKPSALRRRLLWYVMFSVIFSVIADVNLSWLFFFVGEGYKEGFAVGEKGGDFRVGLAFGIEAYHIFGF